MPSPTPARAACPNGQGGGCFGPLAAGTYTTTVFHPVLTYSVPAGWANYEDLPGNFLLTPPGSGLSGVDSGTGDFLGVYASIAVEAPECSGQPARGVARTARAIIDALAARPGIVASTTRSVTIGGLPTLEVDFRMAPGWKGSACSGDHPDVAMITGLAPSDFEHAIGGNTVIRLFLSDTDDGVRAIEIDDVSGGKHLEGFDPVVQSFRFG
jgi:hypothetical protein